jgi:hypothetical protein
MDINRFLNRQSIERYTKLLKMVSDETQRRQISNLLKEEELLREDAEVILKCTRDAAPPRANNLRRPRRGA